MVCSVKKKNDTRNLLQPSNILLQPNLPAIVKRIKVARFLALNKFPILQLVELNTFLGNDYLNFLAAKQLAKVLRVDFAGRHDKNEWFIQRDQSFQYFRHLRKRRVTDYDVPEIVFKEIDVFMDYIEPKFLQIRPRLSVSVERLPDGLVGDKMLDVFPRGLRCHPIIMLCESFGGKGSHSVCFCAFPLSI
jgi:hypothetical protein